MINHKVAVIQEEIAVILAIGIEDAVVLLVDMLIAATMDKGLFGEVDSLKVQVEEDNHRSRIEVVELLGVIGKIQEIIMKEKEKDKTAEEIVPRERYTGDDYDGGRDVWMLVCKKEKNISFVYFSFSLFLCVNVCSIA